MANDKFNVNINVNVKLNKNKKQKKNKIKHYQNEKKDCCRKLENA